MSVVLRRLAHCFRIGCQHPWGILLRRSFRTLARHINKPPVLERLFGSPDTRDSTASHSDAELKIPPSFHNGDNECYEGPSCVPRPPRQLTLRKPGLFFPFRGAWCPASQSNRFDSEGLHARAFRNILDSQSGFFKQQVDGLLQLSPFLNPQVAFFSVDFDLFSIVTNEVTRLVLNNLDIFIAKPVSVNVNPS